MPLTHPDKAENADHSSEAHRLRSRSGRQCPTQLHEALKRSVSENVRHSSSAPGAKNRQVLTNYVSRKLVARLPPSPPKDRASNSLPDLVTFISTSLLLKDAPSPLNSNRLGVYPEIAFPHEQQKAIIQEQAAPCHIIHPCRVVPCHAMPCRKPMPCPVPPSCRANNARAIGSKKKVVREVAQPVFATRNQQAVNSCQSDSHFRRS